MKITMVDLRNEERNSTTTYVNGEVNGRGYRFDNWQKVNDSRSVEVAIESEIDGDVPDLLSDTSGDLTVQEFFVDSVRFTWIRDLESGSWRWHMRRGIIVSGTNRRKNGSRGVKVGVTSYPTTHQEQRGVLELSDFGWHTDAPHFKGGLPGFITRQLGQPRMVDVADPLPAWLDKIVSAHHPVTGKYPFTYGNRHIFGEFEDGDD